MRFQPEINARLNLFTIRCSKMIIGKEIVDPYTIRFKTAAPHPLMPNDLSTIYILSKKAATGAATEDFNSGKATIGSGRFKFVKYVSGDHVDVVRNDGYWGDKPAWDKVTFKIIKNESARRRRCRLHVDGLIEQCARRAELAASARALALDVTDATSVAGLAWQVDGAGFWRHLFQITFPLLLPITLVAVPTVTFTLTTPEPSTVASTTALLCTAGPGVPSACSTQLLQCPPPSRTLISTALISLATPTRSKRCGAAIGGDTGSPGHHVGYGWDAALVGKRPVR